MAQPTPLPESPFEGLIVRHVDNSGRYYYQHTVQFCHAKSIHNENEYSIGGLGWWTLDQTAIASLPQGVMTTNTWYKLELASKPKGPNAQPGSLYQDIKQVRLALPEDMPAQQPTVTRNTPQTGSQDDYRRSKEEIRWTEAMHMAARLASRCPDDEELEPFLIAWTGWFYNELAAVSNPVSDEPVSEEPIFEEPEMPTLPDTVPDEEPPPSDPF